MGRIIFANLRWKKRRRQNLPKKAANTPKLMLKISRTSLLQWNNIGKHARKRADTSRLKWLRIAYLSSRNKNSTCSINSLCSSTSSARKISSRLTLSNTRSSTSIGMAYWRRHRKKTNRSFRS